MRNFVAESAPIGRFRHSNLV
ncbi:hypothetical protein Goshw_002048 [Gossypium schwendimanii]|uniref:Uncharacterized protein n=1 Tax=Gossypium schwendimanii TaxID=34291 RepID=A0A7J9LJH5_GOSSC|nr:hypothetical protein [Gossypium schwendimanii]